MRDHIIPGRMRPRTSGLSSAVSTMGSKQAATMCREAGDQTSTGMATFATHQSMVVDFASTGMGSTRATSAHSAAIAMVAGIMIGADSSGPQRARWAQGSLDLFARELQ